MVNITHKNSTLRKAVATAVVKVSKPETIRAVQERKVPKGDVFEFARAAGLLAVKKTSDVIPDCHPLPVEYTNISYSVEDLNIIIAVEVHTVYKTGVEVEAMHGASVTALVIYDMLKPIDKEVEIFNIKLQNKEGGKSQFSYASETDLRTAVIVCSDSVSSGKKIDSAGKAIVEKLKLCNVHANHYDIITDDRELIRNKMQQLADEQYDLVIFTGGTGLSPRDNTPEAIAPMIDKMIPGIMEAARNYGQQRTPYSMLSRGVAGYIGKTLVITLPGSTKGAAESMDALFPSILHVFPVKKGASHE
jgi:molybdenum cofactor biosynthesis protein MoaC